MDVNPIRPREIGEIAIRCADIDEMFAFYRDVVGLEVFSDTRREGIAFFQVGDGFAGHTTILALFKPDAGRRELHPHTDKKPFTGSRSSLHHLALSVAIDEQEAIKHWLDSRGVPWREQTFDWVGWHGIFFNDPEGNTIELVAADHALLKR